MAKVLSTLTIRSFDFAILLGKDIELMKTKVWKWFALLGGNSNPFDAFLLLNGIKTLEIRMERHCQNAAELANYLQQHKAIEKVNYTGLISHPDYEVAKKQMRNNAPVMSFELKGGLQAGITFQYTFAICSET